jgi:hypothetical protein
LAVFQVLDVTLLPERHDRLLGLEVDSPALGHKGNVYVLHMVGWAVGRDSAARSLEILQHDRVVRIVPIRGPRADVAGALGIPPETDCVFHALVNLIGLKLDTTLVLRAVLEDGSRVDACSITIRREPLRTEFEPTLAPLMVTTLGRSGSTWLMQLLASHPQVVAFRRFPYESAPAKYWLHMLRVLSEPANFEQSAHPDTFHNDIAWVGANPFHDDRVYEQAPLENWFARTQVERLAAFAQRTVEDWYLTLARVQEQPGAVYFAEKHLWPNYLPNLIWELYPRAKEIFLVRDFRDMAQSIMAFDERRGFAGFGRPEGASDEEYLRGELHLMARDLKRSWQTRRDRAHLVRYEELVSRPAEVVTGMLEYLGLDASPETVAGVVAHGSEEILSLPGSSGEPAEVGIHRTIADPQATVGRWQRDRNGTLDSLAEEVFGDALREFGYS